jgi:outer membrane protein OmpA-like peptidoglycan-associated protein
MKGLSVLVMVGVLSGCMGSSPVRASASDGVSRLGSGALAREVQRDAPAAYAEFARSLAQAERATGEERADRVREAELVLAWAATQARVERARERQRSADERVERAREERARTVARAGVLDGESEGIERSTSALERALSSGPPDAAEAATELCQQARLALAAAALMGVAEPQRSAVRARIEAAEQSPIATRLAAAGGALREAEALVRGARAAREPSATALLESLSGGESSVEPRRDRRGVVLTLRALFDARGTLSASATGRLAVVVEALRGHPSMRARVEAFVLGADASRARRTAEERAMRVREALVSRGVDAGRVEAEGLLRLPAGDRAEDVVDVVLLAGD